jgi:hypothetical protein
MNKKILAILALIAPQNIVLGQSSHERLSIEQRQIAVQLERLKILIKEIEREERKRGNEELANTLIEVYETIEDSNNLVLAIEAVAQQLAQKKSSNALEQQALIIERLQELLDMLIQREKIQKDQQEEKLLRERKNAIDSFLKRQNAIKEKISNKNITDTELKEASSLQKELSDELKEFNQQQEEKGIFSNSAESAQKAQEDASKYLDEGMQEESKKMQQQAIEDLKRAQDETQRQQEISQNQKEDNLLRNVEIEIQSILDQHKIDDLAMHEILEDPEKPLKRLDQINLNKIANSQNEIAIKSDELLLDISQAGADSFPFFILQLMQDHNTISERLKVFRNELRDSTLKLSKDLILSWEDLLDVIATERERKRKKMERAENQEEDNQEEGNQEEDNQETLVQFAAEMQLLKRMQKSLGDRIKALVNSKSFSKNDLIQLSERQNELQLQYESMVRRLQGSDEQKTREEL